MHTNGSLFCIKSASGRLYPWQALDAEAAEKWVASINGRRYMLERDSNALPKVDETKWAKLYVEGELLCAMPLIRLSSEMHKPTTRHGRKRYP